MLSARSLQILSIKFYGRLLCVVCTLPVVVRYSCRDLPRRIFGQVPPGGVGLSDGKLRTLLLEHLNATLRIHLLHGDHQASDSKRAGIAELRSDCATRPLTDPASFHPRSLTNQLCAVEARKQLRAHAVAAIVQVSEGQPLTEALITGGSLTAALTIGSAAMAWSSDSAMRSSISRVWLMRTGNRLQNCGPPSANCRPD